MEYPNTMGAYVTPEDEFNGWMFGIATLFIGIGLSGMIAAAILAGVCFYLNN